MFRLLCVFALFASHTVAFMVPTTRGFSTQLYSSYADKLAAAQAAKAQKGGAPQPPAAPAAPQQSASVRAQPAAAAVPFTDAVQGHLQDAIALLSGRLQSGQPLNAEEFSRFETSIGAILVDALAHLSAGTTAAQAAPAARTQATSPQPPAAAVAPPQYTASRAAKPAPQAVDQSQFDDDDNESEGPAWDAEKGYGVPVGTKNTYVIEGMSGMTPDEYQEALRKKVINRAQNARGTRNFGNIAANQYLKFLNDNPTWEVDEKKVKTEDFEQY